MTNIVILFQTAKLFLNFLAFPPQAPVGLFAASPHKKTIFYKPKRASVGRFFSSRKLVFFCSGLSTAIPNAMKSNYVIQLKIISEI